MKKTGSEIEADVYKMVKDSILSSSVNGGVFLDGLRPVNSLKEDIVISFMTGIFDVFHQEGKGDSSRKHQRRIALYLGKLRCEDSVLWYRSDWCDCSDYC